MTKRKIDAMEFAPEIVKALGNGGILLTTKAGEKVNTMTIGWGTIGIEWGTPIFTVFVRASRFTHGQLEANPEFTVNVPRGPFDRKVLGLCGTKSGREMDKIQAAGLTLVEPEVISVPALRELPLTLECRVIYRQDQPLERIEPRFREKFYPAAADGSADCHTAYYGEIVAAYLVEP